MAYNIKSHKKPRVHPLSRWYIYFEVHLKFAEYLFLESSFVSLDKSILLHRRCSMSKFWAEKCSYKNTFQKCTSSRSKMFCTIGVLINVSIFTRKYLCWGLFFIKLHYTFIKKRPEHGVFVCILQIFKAFFMEHVRWLLLKMVEELLKARIHCEAFLSENSMKMVSAEFHETWNTFMKNLYSSTIKKVFTEKRYLLTVKI